MYDSRGRFSVQLKTDFSAWETVFLWKTTVRDSRVGSVCSPLCSLFDDLQLMILFKQTPNTASLLIMRCSAPVDFVNSTFQPNTAVVLFEETYTCVRACVHTHTHTHTHTHILYFPAQMVSSLSSYEWGHRYFPVCWHALSIARLIPTTTASSWKMWDAPDEMMWADFSVQWKGSGELYAWKPSSLCPQKSLWHLKTTASAGLTTLPLRDQTMGSGQKKIIDFRCLEWSNTGRHGASPNWNSNCTMCGGWFRL